jgi:hypothetical protein
MSSVARKVVGVVVVVAAVGVLTGFYVSDYLTSGPATLTPPTSKAGAVPVVNLTLQTVAAVGPELSPNPDWVSYLIRENGAWVRSTIWQLPANAIVHVTIYNFDGASGLRNPLFGRPQGVVGNVMKVDGKTLTSLPPEDASHTFAVPDLGVIVPVAPVPDDAPNQCDYAPCPMSNAHRTIQFTFRTGKPGKYRWQCFVPCAAGFLYGFGGPMQTIGYMDGYLNVV